MTLATDESAPCDASAVGAYRFVIESSRIVSCQHFAIAQHSLRNRRKQNIPSAKIPSKTRKHELHSGKRLTKRLRSEGTKRAAAEKTITKSSKRTKDILRIIVAGLDAWCAQKRAKQIPSENSQKPKRKNQKWELVWKGKINNNHHEIMCSPKRLKLSSRQCFEHTHGKALLFFDAGRLEGNYGCHRVTTSG